jgi:hypothetical protein
LIERAISWRYGLWKVTTEKNRIKDKHIGFNKERTLCKSFDLPQCWHCPDRKYFSDMTFFNLKTRSIDVLWLKKGLLRGCFPFQFTFIAKEKNMVTHKKWNCLAFKNNYPKLPFFSWYTKTSLT